MSVTILDEGAISPLLIKASAACLTPGATDIQLTDLSNLQDSFGEVKFDDSLKKYTPYLRICDSSIVDNRNGLVGPTNVTLSYVHTDTVSASRTLSHSVKVGYAYEVQMSATLFGLGESASSKFSIEYTFNISDTTTKTESDQRTFTQTVQTTVPAGKVYKTVLVGTAEKLDIPYVATVMLGGEYGVTCVKPDGGAAGMPRATPAYSFRCLADPGYPVEHGGADISHDRVYFPGVTGILNAQQTANFTINTYDITNETNGGHELELKQSANPHSIPEGAILISSVPVS